MSQCLQNSKLINTLLKDYTSSQIEKALLFRSLSIFILLTAFGPTRSNIQQIAGHTPFMSLITNPELDTSLKLLAFECLLNLVKMPKALQALLNDSGIEVLSSQIETLSDKEVQFTLQSMECFWGCLLWKFIE